MVRRPSRSQATAAGRSDDGVRRVRSAGVAQLVEHDVANVVVVGSNPITRSCLVPFVFRSQQAIMSDIEKRDPEDDLESAEEAVDESQRRGRRGGGRGTAEAAPGRQDRRPQRLRAAHHRDRRPRGHRSLLRQGVQRVDADGAGAGFSARARPAEADRASLPQGRGAAGQGRAVDGQPARRFTRTRISRRSASRTSTWTPSRCPRRGL